MAYGQSKLAEVIGTRGVMALSDHFGGRRVYVPTKPERATNFHGVIDDTMLDVLCHMFGGGRVYIPSGRCEHRKVSRRKVMAMTRRDMSADTIAQKLKCSDRTVYAIRAEAAQTA